MQSNRHQITRAAYVSFTHASINTVLELTYDPATIVSGSMDDETLAAIADTAQQRLVKNLNTAVPRGLDSVFSAMKGYDASTDGSSGEIVSTLNAEIDDVSLSLTITATVHLPLPAEVIRRALPGIVGKGVVDVVTSWLYKPVLTDYLGELQQASGSLNLEQLFGGALFGNLSGDIGGLRVIGGFGRPFGSSRQPVFGSFDDGWGSPGSRQQTTASTDGGSGSSGGGLDPDTSNGDDWWSGAGASSGGSEGLDPDASSETAASTS